jgi:hypothetical protein
MEKPYVQLDITFNDERKEVIQYKKMTEAFRGNDSVQTFYDENDEVVFEIVGNNLEQAGITSFNLSIHTDAAEVIIESPLYRVEVEEIKNEDSENDG